MTLNLPGPYNFLLTILLTFIAPGTASAANDMEPRANPFELPPGIYSKDNIPAALPQRLILQAIFDVNGKRIATISGENFMQGDFAFGKRVLSILDNRVILDAGGKEEILVLEKTRFKLRKHNRK